MCRPYAGSAWGRRTYPIWSLWKGGGMRKLLLRILLLVGGFIAGLVSGLLLPDAQRLRLSQQLALGIGRVAEQMPDG
jgi:hypothetical protein